MSCTANNDLCRLCQQHPGAYNVYMPDPVHSSTSPAARIMWVTQLQVLDGDGLPTEICRQCWIQLNAAYSFIEQCLATDKSLRTRSQSQVQDICGNTAQMLEVSLQEDEDDYDDTTSDDLRKSCTSEVEAVIKVEQEDSMTFGGDESEHSLYVCSICDGSFKVKRAYIVHMQLHADAPEPLGFNEAKSSATQPYQCELCSRTFTWASHLKRHVRKHTGDNPYKCTLCDKAFYRQDHLTKHFRSHTGERPYQCTLCRRSFTRRDHLTSHIKIHMQVKPFGCALCSKSFFKQSGLVRHLKNHPPVSDSNYLME